MKSYAAIGLATMFGVTAAETPQVQGIFNAAGETDEEKRADAIWYIDGVQGFYEGYYKAFYKTSHLNKDSEACLNDKTIDNIVSLYSVVADPMSVITGGDFTKDFNLFAQAAEVMENLSSCHFEQSVFDIMQECNDNPEDCTIGAVTQNLSKDMFVLMGKLTSVAETVQGFPADDNGDFKEQMREFGSDAGTALRVIFGYRSEAEKSREAHRRH